LGCGRKKWPGFINVDLYGDPDVVADITKELPFPSDYADEIHAYHVLEHLYRWTVDEVLAEWIRVLKPGGQLILELPCMDKVVSYLTQCMTDNKPIKAEMTMWALYGDPSTQKSEADLHKWCWGQVELARVLQRVGLENVTHQKPTTHVPQRDMRLIGTKPQRIIIE
jgi:ubiquinone/menaquinone biosynthesis C-methylase UbiE